MERPTKEMTVELMKELHSRYKLEEIAIMLDRSYATVHKWYSGTRIPHKGDWELLKRIKEGR